MARAPTAGDQDHRVAGGRGGMKEGHGKAVAGGDGLEVVELCIRGGIRLGKFSMFYNIIT